MNVTKIDGAWESPHEAAKPETMEDMQHDYNYILAGQMTKKLLDAGLITKEEYDMIMAKNRQSFPSLISSLYPTESLITQDFRGNMSPNESEVGK
jgi:hypothetical protein